MVIFGTIYVFTNSYIHKITTDERRGHKLKREQEECKGRFRGEESEARHVVIEMQSHNYANERKDIWLRPRLPLSRFVSSREAP